MPTNVEDARNIKKKILEILKLKGPGLPVQIASQTGINSLFAGAFLSELAKDKLIKISYMKVGGSPLYFIQGQEQALEKFYIYLAGKEKEAFLLLKKEKILKDTEQAPAIRVALRNLHDFAFAFRKDDEIMWRFHSFSEQEIRNLFEKPKPTPKTTKPTARKQVRQIRQTRQETQLDIGLQPIKEIITKIRKKVNPIRKAGQNFLEEIKLFLQNKEITITNLEEVSKRKIIAKITINSQPCLLAAFNKKRVTEKELIKTYKLALTFNLPYYILTRDNPTKKMSEAMQAYKNLLKIDKFE